MPIDFMDLPETDDFRSLFLNNTPLIDVRAPVEFSHGAFPCAENHPLMDDADRHEIGIRYADKGQDAAIELGRERVDPALETERVAAWETFARKHPEGALYCFRGGMRSKISQQWLYEHTGILYPRVLGGYKALRRFLIDELEPSCANINPLLISGRTGSGKTAFLLEYKNVIDLEGLANHRGSAFGPHADPQPTQIDFENRLSIALMQFAASPFNTLLLEDESRNIGARYLPPVVFERMTQAPMVLLEASVESRIEVLLQDYAVDTLKQFRDRYGDAEGFDRWAEHGHSNLAKIRKRLGAARHADIVTLAEKAEREHRKTGSVDAHRDWIRMLLEDYYDPMYDHSIGKKADRILFSGNAPEVREFVANKGLSA